jgi:hypothetical protein
MLPISGWLFYTGLQPGKPFVAWALVAFGVAGLVAFSVAAVAVIRTMRAPWHLALSPSSLVLSTPAYDLDVPWERITGIAVDEVNRRFRDLTTRRGTVADAATMRDRMEENYGNCGYHLGIPGRILELGPDELAGLLAQARTGALWHVGEAGA